MKKNYILLIIIIVFIIGLLFGNKITGNVVISKDINKQITALETCIYQTRTGINVIPNKEICCKNIKEFFKCESIDETDIEYGQYYSKVSKQCYNNKNSELRIYFREDLENFCKNEGYL